MEIDYALEEPSPVIRKAMMIAGLVLILGSLILFGGVLFFLWPEVASGKLSYTALQATTYATFLGIVGIVLIMAR